MKSKFGIRAGDTLIATALAAGKTQAEAAVLAGVSPRTVARRMNDPDFRGAILEARAALMERATGKLADATTAAADELVELLKSKSAWVRLAAARELLQTARDYHRLVDINERLDQLEDALQKQQSTKLQDAGNRSYARH